MTGKMVNYEQSASGPIARMVGMSIGADVS
jgi:hypothetical protein